MSSDILLIDDEENLRKLLARILELEGYHVLQASTAKQGLKILDKEEVSLVVSDVRLPDDNGIDLISRIKEKSPLAEIVVITAYGTIADGVKAIKAGAFDYITKGDGDEQIIPVISRAIEKATMQKRIKQLEEKLYGTSGCFESIIGQSPLLKSAIELAEKVAPTDATVLLLGETGTGKEVFAQAIHESSHRKAKAFVAINCSAIAKDLLESEMFGHKAGAFTGAAKDKKGLVDEASNGTLFLDEIGELNADLQAKMLRFLETGTFYPVGSTKPVHVNVRIITATNRNLLKETETGRFREDLYYRLSAFTINLPPLRDRKEDIKVLANHFLNIYAAKVNKPSLRFDDDFIAELKKLEYKGNIRELKNIVERAAILAKEDIIGRDLIPLEYLNNNHSASSSSLDLAEIEKQHILQVLQHVNGNKTKAAELLGIGVTTLYRKLHEYGIE
jgi:DNA-binding NtrC family response regulator